MGDTGPKSAISVADIDSHGEWYHSAYRRPFQMPMTKVDIHLVA